ncbi:hypothetical protein [Mesorhizobium sp.]|uniref:hypothetical protein n=1 Tax=Mesorhizobium sp. TaxID=1871066 RepID=UPI000FE4896D|nr:hypothetical protein [Mesorhizobium sp.]RWF33760.1 MAG: hypothetical protein EOS45_02180 [Mesorhizobium sp.]
MGQWGKPIVCEGVTFLPHYNTDSNAFAPIGPGSKVDDVQVTDIRCPKCGIPIEFDQIEYVTRDTDDPLPRRVHTGEVIVTVSCHGETWRVSNKRGKLPHG